LTNAVSLVPSLSWLTGPIFDKELRVSSRRRRNYALRSVYIMFLCLFILYVWLITLNFGRGGSTAFLASRMAEAGRQVVAAIIWFQFVAAQLMAIVLLSTSIGNEIRLRTLSVLMTTPITSLQIVMGKLLSNLLQVVLLLAISLPLLAILRVLGGVPWNHVVSSFCITLTAAIFAGALSLLLSMTSRHAYTVVVTVMTGYLLVFGAIYGVAAMLSSYTLVGQVYLDVVKYVLNPFGALYMALSAGATAGTSSSWPLHCAVMLLAAAAVVSLAVCRVRRIALGRAFGGATKVGQTRLRPWIGKRRRPVDAVIRRVNGAPIVWKEMRNPAFAGTRRGFILYAVLTGTILAGLIIPTMFGVGFIGPVFSYLLMGLSLVVFIRLAVASAGSITVEKEAGSWPILLTTPLDDKAIVRGKAVAAFRGNMKLLLLLMLLYTALFVVLMLSSGMAFYFFLYIFMYALDLACTAVFVIGVGLYLGVRMKSTNAAVAATVGMYIGVILIGRTMFSYLLVMTIYRWLSPSALVGMWLVPVMIMAVPACICAGVGVLAARRARRRLRRNIF